MADYAGGSNVTVAAATVTAVLPTRMGRRIAVSIANYGANDVYLLPSDTQAPATGYGILLKSGGIFTDSNNANYLAWQGAFQVYSAAGSNLAVWERCSI